MLKRLLCFFKRRPPCTALSPLIRPPGPCRLWVFFRSARDTVRLTALYFLTLLTAPLPDGARRALQEILQKANCLQMVLILMILILGIRHFLVLGILDHFLTAIEA